MEWRGGRLPNLPPTTDHQPPCFCLSVLSCFYLSTYLPHLPVNLPRNLPLPITLCSSVCTLVSANLNRHRPACSTCAHHAHVPTSFVVLCLLLLMPSTSPYRLYILLLLLAFYYNYQLAINFLGVRSKLILLTCPSQFNCLCLMYASTLPNPKRSLIS